MKILHLADLHIGKKVNGFCMLNEQKFVLSQALELIKNENIEAVLIAGDVFDRPIPQIGALEVFDNFLKELNRNLIKVLIISGNHDNMDRLAYLSNLLEQSQIYFSKSFEGKIQSVEISDNISVYLIPYLYPALVKKYYPEKQIQNYNDAMKAVVDDIKIDKNKINIALMHQFVTGKEAPLLSQSEQKSAGGIDEISYKILKKFDYCALGHLHCPQKCANERIQYAGSILKYSFSEINQIKKFVVLDVISKQEINFKYYPIKFTREMKQYSGFIDDFLNKNFYENIDTNNYIHFILKDEYALDAKKRLSLVYPNIMLLEFDNSFTKNLNSNFNGNIRSNKSILEHFGDFYKIQTNNELDKEKEKIAQEISKSEGL